jgi:hypothetical protein
VDPEATSELLWKSSDEGRADALEQNRSDWKRTWQIVMKKREEMKFDGLDMKIETRRNARKRY